MREKIKRKGKWWFRILAKRAVQDVSGRKMEMNELLILDWGLLIYGLLILDCGLLIGLKIISPKPHKSIPPKNVDREHRVFRRWLWRFWWWVLRCRRCRAGGRWLELSWWGLLSVCGGAHSICNWVIDTRDSCIKRWCWWLRLTVTQSMAITHSWILMFPGLKLLAQAIYACRVA